MLEFGISPCPNDIFIFYAIMNQKIDLQGFQFKFLVEDVEKLNSLCMDKRLPISKISAHALFYLQGNYEYLNTGGAISEMGPVVVAKDKNKIENSKNLRVILPGRLTTASALMWFYWKENFLGKSYILDYVTFNEIIEKLMTEQGDMGVLIHEGRFVYESYGLKLIADLGEFWKIKTHLPIPLGCIVVKKDLKLKEKLETLIKNSIQYAYENFEEVMPFVKKYAQELDDNVIISHIKTYVNEFSLELGCKGRESIEALIKEIKEVGIWK